MDSTAGKPQPSKEEVTESPSPDPPSPASGRSYVVAIYLWEQMMAASYNSLQMQCWAMTLRTNPPIRTVEPQAKLNRSILGFSFIDDTLPVVSDIFNMDSWYTQWHKRGPPLAPMTTRTDFLDEIRHFQKQVILVQTNFKRRKDGFECSFTWNITSLMKELEQYPLLKVVRKVCIYSANAIPVATFNELVFGEVGNKNIVVILKEWRGILLGGKTDIRGTPCSGGPTYGLVRPSSSILKDAENFANEHLGGFGQYLSVSARFEKVPKKYWERNPKKRRAAIAAATKESLTKILNFKNKCGLNSLYLAYDYGLYGSRTFEQELYYNSSDLLERFQEDLYDGKLPHAQYKELLKSFKFVNPGYIAMVQMTLSSKGKCIYLVGSGFCINFVSSLFKSFHPGDSSCVGRAF